MMKQDHSTKRSELCVSQDSPEEMYTYREVCCKELAYVIMETNRSRIFRMGQQAGDPEKTMIGSKSKGCLLQNSLLLGRSQCFFLGRPSTDCMRPNMSGRALLFT